VNINPVNREIRVLIIDADPLATRAVTAALAGAGDIALVGAAQDRQRGMELAAASSPDVVVLDELMDADGPSLVQQLNAVSSQPAVLVLSRTHDDETGVRTLRHGAAGYLNKHVSLEVLPRLVRALASGETVMSRAMTTQVVHKLREAPESGAGLRPVRSPLSTREWEVLDLLCAGASTRQIAGELDLTVETVRSHVKRVLRKLDSHSRAEAVQRAQALLARPQARRLPPGGHRSSSGSLS
jgi:DNA-binding NarL/FixJ family response regulator